MGDMMKTYKVELRDLESLLRKKLGDDLVVIKYNTESLLPPGENYGSTIMKVVAAIKRKRDDKAQVENLNLVAKLLPVSEIQRIMFDSAFTFRKETFLYEELIPAYQRLEREFGVEDNEVFDIVAEFYGARFSLSPDVDFDNDAVILLSNLKVQGYYVADRRQGLDLSHAKIAATALARFHALGIALKIHKPEYFEIVKTRAKCFNIQSGSFDESILSFLQLVHEDPVMSKHYDVMKKMLTRDIIKAMTEPPTEPWATIIHSDFWVNNFMFRKDTETGQVTGIKFVDFQNYLFLSPLRELTFFLMTNPNKELMANNFEELVDCYYDNFISALRRLKCDVEPFSRDKFDERWKIDAFQEFSHIPFLLKIMTANEEESKAADMSLLMKTKGLNPLFFERLYRVVNKYEEKGWFSENTS